MYGLRSYMGDRTMIGNAPNPIIERLKSGDRLIAMTAAGVSWSSDGTYPDFTQLQTLLNEGQLILVGSSVGVGGGVYAPVHEIGLTDGALRSVITGVPGWESPDEQYRLLDLAQKVPQDGVIVEVGAEFGMSASIFIYGTNLSHHIFSVDLFPRDMLARHQKNLEIAGLAGRSIQIQGDSAEIGKEWKRQIDLLFIDGDHTYEGVWRDMRAWMGHVKPRGTAAFHDAAPPTNRIPHYLHLEVQRAIDEYMRFVPGLFSELDPVDSMRVFKRND